MISRTVPGCVLPLLLIGSAAADEPQLPLMKEGLWESHTQQVLANGKSDMVIKICQSHAIEQSMKAVGDNVRKQNECTETMTRHSASSYSSSGHCDKGPLSGTVTQTTISYQGDTASHLEMHMVKGQSEHVTIVDSHYLGSCPANMKPGDAVLPDGSKINMAPPAAQ